MRKNRTINRIPGEEGEQVPIPKVNKNGSIFYMLNGRCHRLDGPAVYHTNGDCEWWYDGEVHRENGPAVEFSDGEKQWYFHDKRHRLDGPAVEYGDGRKEWYYLGDKVECESQEEFERLIKLRSLW